MIEKIEMPEMDETYKSAMFAKVLGNKINELVDAVNELQEQYDNVCIWVGEQKLKTPAKNVQDEFAEQRKWIGKLCRFRDNPACEWKYGILYRIYEDAEFPFWDTDCYEYAECEPVKPDDDIICKGE